MADLTRQIIGIENRTAQEVFDIMCDRFRRAPSPSPAPGAVEALIEKYAMACKRNAHEMAGMPITVIMQHFREFADELASLSQPAKGEREGGE